MGDVTRLLELTQAGDRQSRDALFALVYDELRKLARRALAREATLTNLDAPSLVHEAYMLLTNKQQLPGQNRRMFYAYSARIMRGVIIDQLRERQAQKRGGDVTRVTLNTGVGGAEFKAPEIEALDSAMKTLAQIDARGHDVVEMRFFGGLSIDEIGEVLEISPATIKRDWQKARAFLFKEMGGTRTP